MKEVFVRLAYPPDVDGVCATGPTEEGIEGRPREALALHLANDAPDPSSGEVR